MAEMADTAALREENAELRARLEARDAELAALREENAKLKETVSEHELAETFATAVKTTKVAELELKLAKCNEELASMRLIASRQFKENAELEGEPEVEEPEVELEPEVEETAAEYEEFRLTMIQAVSGNPMEFECVDGLFKKYCRKYIEKEALRKIANNPDTLIAKYFKSEEDFED